jgi:DnaJ-class molecular chaperone
MGKYKVERLDGRDNSDEVYIVVRVDLGAKDVHRNRKGIKKLCKILRGSDKWSSIESAKEIRKLIKKLEKQEKTCPTCKGEGEFEVSAGSHSYFEDCSKCNGKGVISNEKD